nr:hypothetical protein [Pseudomonas glycinae]
MATKTLLIKGGDQMGADLFNPPLLMSSIFLWSSSVSESNASPGDVLNFVDEFQVASQFAPLKRTAYEL